MEVRYEYKKQGNGQDSWIKIEIDEKGNETPVDLVFQNPEQSKLIPFIDAIKKATPEELIEIANLLKPYLK
jgi:hypothetical protein